MKIESLKLGGVAHRIWTGAIQTPDPWAFYVPAGSPVLEADGTRWSSPYAVILQFWPGRFYQVCHLLKAGGTEHYCNIIAPLAYRPGQAALAYVDLELDVAVAGGEVRVLDQEEFRAQVPAMPSEWVSSCLDATAHLQFLAHEQTGPFAPSADQYWRHWLRAATPGSS